MITPHSTGWCYDAVEDVCEVVVGGHDDSRRDACNVAADVQVNLMDWCIKKKAMLMMKPNEIKDS